MAQEKSIFNLILVQFVAGNGPLGKQGGDDVRLLQEFFNHNPDVNVNGTYERKTALYYTVAWKRPNCTRFLLRRGAYVENGNNGNDETPLQAAARNNDLEMVQILLTEGGAMLEARSSTGATALHKPSWYGMDEIVSFLIQQGANVNTPDDGGNTPFMLAAQSGKLSTLKILCAEGEPNLSLQNEEYRSALELAQLARMKDCEDFLRDFPTLKSRWKISALVLMERKDIQQQLPEVCRLIVLQHV